MKQFIQCMNNEEREMIQPSLLNCIGITRVFFTSLENVKNS